MFFPSFARTATGLALLSLLALLPAARVAAAEAPAPTPRTINYRTRVTIPLPAKQPTPHPQATPAVAPKQPVAATNPLLLIPRPTPFGAPPVAPTQPSAPTQPVAARPTPFGARTVPSAAAPVNPLLIIPRPTPFIPKSEIQGAPAPAHAATPAATPAAPPAAVSTPPEKRVTTLPLYRQYPPEQIIVGEVGRKYLLTRRDLELMVGNVVTPALEAKQTDEYIAQEIERRKRVAEDDTLMSWAVVKTIAERARLEGLTVSEQEIDARMNQISQEAAAGGQPSGPLQVVGADQAGLRQDMRDGLLTDKYILREIEKTFKETDLEARFHLHPERYSVPESVHAWQIVKIIPKDLTDQEILDLRESFYEVRKRAAKSAGRDFEAVAREATDSPVGKKTGGDLGWVDVRSQLPEEVLEALLGLKVGEVSQIVQSRGVTPSVSSKLIGGGGKSRIQAATGGALHILRITERTEAQGLAFDAFSRQRVIDDLIAEYKVVRGRQVIQTAPFPVRMNATGLRLLNAPAPRRLAMSAPRAPHLLQVNPWITDVSAFDLWAWPLGLLYWAARLRRWGARVTLLDCTDRAHPAVLPRTPASKAFHTGKYHAVCFEEQPEPARRAAKPFRRYGIPPDAFEEALDALERESGAPPDAVLVTSRMTYWYHGVRDAIHRCKARWPRTPLLLGGIYATLCPEHARASTQADHILSGNGFREMTDFFRKNWPRLADRAAVPGPDPASWPPPAVDLCHRRLALPLLTSVGCPFQCAYCASGLLSGEHLRRSSDAVLEEIRLHHAFHGTTDFVFYDDALLVQPNRFIVPLLDGIRVAGLPVRFHAPNGLHYGPIDGDLARRLFEAPVPTVRLSLESSRPERLAAWNRRFSIAPFRAAVGALRQAGYGRDRIGVYLMAGIPGQTFEEVRDAIELVHAAGATPRLNEYSPIPGTALWQEALRLSGPEIAADPLWQNNSLYHTRPEAPLRAQWEELRALARPRK